MTTWVIKIGTSILRGGHEYTTFDIINNYCSYISKAQRNGDKVILVSSGAVGLGCHKMSFKTRPREIISLGLVLKFICLHPSPTAPLETNINLSPFLWALDMYEQ